MTGAERIAAERCRQIEVEDWQPQHDDGYTQGELRRAAISYAQRSWRGCANAMFPPRRWPWAWDWWKPSISGEFHTVTASDAIRMLEKAGALIAAEIDRLLREQAQESDGRQA